MQKHKIIVVLGLWATTLAAYSCRTHFETTKTDFTVVKSDQAFERGKVLVFSSCEGCHYNRQAHKFIGNRITDVPGIAGKVYSANLTQSKTHGIPPQYTDAQLRYLLKTGVAKDGRFIGYMLRPNMADEDINDIIVFLRSNDPSVAADDTTVGLTDYSFVGHIYMGMSAKPLPYLANLKRPTEPVALGAYLVDNLGCFHCHSKSLTSVNYLYPAQSPGYLAGGAKLKGADGLDIRASNITFDKNTGIGNYTREDFRKAIKDGKAPDRTLKAPMPKLDMLSDGEVDAIYAYLQTVPGAEHKVEKR